MKRIVYPVPWMASMLVSMVKKMLDETTREKLMVVAGDEKALDCPVALNEHLTLGSLPRHCWHKNKSLKPGRTSNIADSPQDTVSPKDDVGNDGDDFFSASEGEDDEDADLESGLVTMRFAVREPTITEHSRQTCWWHLLFMCRCCRHRAHHKQYH